MNENKEKNEGECENYLVENFTEIVSFPGCCEHTFTTTKRTAKTPIKPTE